MTDRHCNPHAWEMEQEYFKGIRDAHDHKDDDRRHQEGTYPYEGGWQVGYVNSGRKYADISLFIEKSKRGMYLDK